MKIVYKILLAVVLPTIIVSVLFIFFIHNLLYNEVEQRFLLSMENSTKNYASLIDLRLSIIADMANETANSIEKLDNPDKKKVYELIHNNLSSDSLIYGSSIFFDTTYEERLKTTFFYAYHEDSILKKIELNNKSDNYKSYFSKKQYWITAPKTTKQGVWTSPYYDKGLSNCLLITYSAPIIINNKYIGVTTFDIKVNDLNELLLINEKEIEGEIDPDLYVINTGDSLFVYAERKEFIGQFIYDVTEKPKYYQAHKFSILDSILIMKTGLGYINDNLQKKSFIAFYAPVKNTKWMVVNVIENSKVKSYISKAINLTILIVVCFVGVIIFLIYFTSKIITNPISKLSLSTKEISKGNYDYNIEINRNDEVGSLAKNFRVMKNKLMERELKLKEANTKLMVLDEAKNKFLELISHEIRTPLNGIIGSTYILKDTIEDPELKEFLEMLTESVNRLDKFSKIALEITQMQTVGLDLPKQNVDISKIISHLLESNKSLIKEKKISIDSTISEFKYIKGIEEYLKRTFEELLINAIKYADEGGVIKIKTLINNSKLHICLTNKGQTIPADKIEEIVKPFGLANEHYDKHIGLGLAYVKACLDLHNAKMKIQSLNGITEICIIFEDKES